MVSAKEIAARMESKKKKLTGAQERDPGPSDEEEGVESDVPDARDKSTVKATGPEIFGGSSDDDAGGEPAADDSGEMGDYDSIEDSAVQDIMNSKDPATVKTALRQFVKACMDRDTSEE